MRPHTEDVILEVNGESMAGKDHGDVVEALVAAGSTFELTVVNADRAWVVAAEEIAVQAGAIIKAGREDGYEIMSKGGVDLVTAIDQASEKSVRHPSTPDLPSFAVGFIRPTHNVIALCCTPTPPPSLSLSLSSSDPS
jgi:hypothetical protein